MSSEVAAGRGVTTRVLVAGFLLIPLNVFFITGFSWLVDDFTGWSPIFANTLTIVFLLALVNPLLKRWRPRWAFGVGEIYATYGQYDLRVAGNRYAVDFWHDSWFDCIHAYVGNP